MQDRPQCRVAMMTVIQLKFLGHTVDELIRLSLRLRENGKSLTHSGHPFGEDF